MQNTFHIYPLGMLATALLLIGTSIAWCQVKLGKLTARGANFERCSFAPVS